MNFDDSNRRGQGSLLSNRNLVAFSVIMAACWLWPFTRTAFDTLDELVFFALNGTLRKPGWWRNLWCFANHRAFDLVMGVCYAAFVLIYCFRADAETSVRRTADIIAMLLLLAVCRILADYVTDIIDYRRLSPSRVLEPAVRVSEYVQGWKVKDGSRDSFPGDHALVSWFILLYFLRRSSKTYILAATVISIIACVPRLIVGAHWLTDLIVGSMFIAVTSWALFEATGLFDVVSRAARKVARWPTLVLHRTLHPRRRGASGTS